MNQQTEIAIRSVLATDDSVDTITIESAMRIMRREGCGEAKPIKALLFRELIELLGVSRRSVTNYVNRGLLDLVYGAGTQRARGVTMESYNKFIHERSQKRNPPSPEKEKARLAAIEEKAKVKSRILNGKILEIRRLLKLEKTATAKARYRAISRLLDSTNRFSQTLVCNVAEVSLTAYINYKRRPKEHWMEQRRKENIALQIIRANLINPNEKIGLLVAHKLVKDHGLNIAVKTIARLLDANGFNRERKGTVND